MAAPLPLTCCCVLCVPKGPVHLLLIEPGSHRPPSWATETRWLPVPSGGRWADGWAPFSCLPLGERLYPFRNPASNLEFFFQVEIWLNHVLAHMKATVRHGMTEGVVAYEEKPREQWLFDYPAQVFSPGALWAPLLARSPPPGKSFGLEGIPDLKLTVCFTVQKAWSPNCQLRLSPAITLENLGLSLFTLSGHHREKM